MPEMTPQRWGAEFERARSIVFEFSVDLSVNGVEAVESADMDTVIPAIQAVLIGCPHNEVAAQGLALLNAATDDQAEALVALLECVSTIRAMPHPRSRPLDDFATHRVPQMFDRLCDVADCPRTVADLRDALRERKEGAGDV